MERLIYNPNAKIEIKEAASYYEECREGLGKQFLDAVEHTVREINF